MSLYQNTHRIESARLQSWDYGWNAAYFITICAHRRLHYFGEVADEQMQLSEIGMIADRCWVDIPNHFPFVKLGVHIVMPNHVHGIVVIDRHDETNPGLWGDGGGDDIVGGDGCGSGGVETQDLASLPSSYKPPPSPYDDSPKNKFGPQSKNLASIIRGYKTGVTKHARKIHPNFKWQPRYHDHIIRNNRTFQRISRYIQDNPQNWDKDVFFTKH